MRGLTSRGRAVLAGGLVLVAIAVLLGQRDLLRAAVLALALPVICLAVVSRARYRITCARGLSSPSIPVGGTCTSLVRIENSSRLPGSLMLVQDSIPDLVGDPVRAVIPRLEPGARREISTRLTGQARGRYQVGPASLLLRDPFGLVELTRSFTASDTLVVTPHLTPLPNLGIGGQWGGRGDSEARSIAHSGDDDVIPREYRIGDELRRVHWRATARAGELMVRREEQPWRTSATIVVDRRTSAHRGSFPDSSFEAAMSVAASAAIHLMRHGLLVRVVDLDGSPLASSTEHGGELLLLDSLAVVDAVHGVALADSAPLRRALADGLLLAVVSHLNDDEARVLATLRGGGSAAALVVAQSAWSTDETAIGSSTSTASLLARHGWHTAVFSPPRGIRDLPAFDQSLIEAWESLASPSLVAGSAR